MIHDRQILTTRDVIDDELELAAWARGTASPIVIEEKMDYAFCPGGSDGPRLLREVFKLRTNTKVLDTGEKTLLEFMEWLRNEEAVSGAAGSILIGAHGNDSGWISMDSGDAHVHDTEKPKEITFKFLETVLDTAIDHRPFLIALSRPACMSLATTKVHLKGCNIGQARPFLEKFKRLLGNIVTVTAPLHFYQIRDNGSLRGIVEFLCYEFEARVAAGSKQESPLDTPKKIIDAFIAAQHKDIHGVRIPDSVWKTMVSDDMKETGWRPHKITIAFGRAMPHWWAPGSIAPEMTVTNDTFVLDGQRRHDRHEIKLDVEHSGNAPANQNAGKQILKQRWPTDPAIGVHPTFPMHLRFGYASINDFVDGYFWKFEPRADNRMTCTGWRHRYRLLVPVTDPAGNVIFNFSPKAGNTNPPIRLLDENNAKLFMKV